MSMSQLQRNYQIYTLLKDCGHDIAQFASEDTAICVGFP